MEEVVSGQRVLDYGSGSGILGLAALSFGAKEVQHKTPGTKHKLLTQAELFISERARSSTQFSI